MRVVTLGEMMLRLMPKGNLRFEQATEFDAYYGGDCVYVMDQISDESSSDESWLEDIALREALCKLGDRERAIIEARYYRGKTQMEIAAEIGISQAQVSRLEKGALETIRRYI